MKFHYTAAARTDVGICKSINQDSLTVKVANTPLGEAAIAILCDGMGGLEHGEVASAVVVRAYDKWFMEEFPNSLIYGADSGLFQRSWRGIAIECNGRIMDYSKSVRATMGTTLTILLLIDGSYYISHVGDCRVYVMGNGIEQLTADQTYVAREVALGHMTPLQAQNDSRRNVLLQCIGTGKNIEPEFYQGRVYKGDSFLLCSDGFRHEITEKEIYDKCHNGLLNIKWGIDNRLENSGIMSSQLKNLIETNKKRGEKDNISAILIKVLEG